MNKLYNFFKNPKNNIIFFIIVVIILIILVLTKVINLDGHENNSSNEKPSVIPDQNTLGGAYDILVKYNEKMSWGKKGIKYNVILIGDRETLETDLGNPIAQKLVSQGGKIIHITKDTDYYRHAPSNVQKAVDLFNNLGLKGYVNEKLGSIKHVIGLATADDEAALQKGVVVNGVLRRFGYKVYISEKKKYIWMYGSFWGGVKGLSGQFADTGFKIGQALDEDLGKNVFSKKLHPVKKKFNLKCNDGRDICKFDTNNNIINPAPPKPPICVSSC